MFSELYFYRKIYPGILNFKFIKEVIYYFLKGISKHPVSINILVTSKCNFKCSICSYYGNSDSSFSEIRFENIINLLDQIKNFKPVIFLGGGEPFLRKDIYSILKEIQDRQLKVIVSTNGYMLDLDKLSSFNLDSLIVSIYGPELIHDSITGVPNSYSIVTKKIKNIVEHKLVKNLVVSTVLTSSNYKSIIQFVNSIFSLGVDSVKIENLNYITEEEKKYSLSSFDGLILKPHTLVLDRHCFSDRDLNSIWRDIEVLKKKYKGRLFLKPNLNKRDFLKWYSDDKNIKECHFIKHSIFISSSGDIIPCQFLRETKLGKIERDAVECIWNSKRYKNFRKFIGGANLAICKRCCK